VFDFVFDFATEGCCAVEVAAVVDIVGAEAELLWFKYQLPNPINTNATTAMPPRR
jgi:hypothetical protein